MVYVGGLTFAEQSPEKLLRIPNSIAAQRFGETILDNYRLSTVDITNALQWIISTDDMSVLLGYYKRLMSERDVGEGDLRDKNEESHRDSICCVFLKNPLLLQATPEFEVTKPSKFPGRVDMLIKAPSTKCVIISEWKFIKISFIDIKPMPASPGHPWRSLNCRKADVLNNISDTDIVLNLPFAAHDKFGRAGKTIREWVFQDDGPANQVKQYWKSQEIVQLHDTHKVVGYLVVIVGSRKILLWRLDKEGFLEAPVLVGE